jgi:hypothetical protein
MQEIPKDIINEIRKISKYDCDAFSKKWLENQGFDYDYAIQLLSKNKSLKSLLDIKRRKGLPFNENRELFEKIMVSDAYFPIKEEIIYDVNKSKKKFLLCPIITGTEKGLTVFIDPPNPSNTFACKFCHCLFSRTDPQCENKFTYHPCKGGHVPNISKVYQHALAKGMDADTRAMLEAEMVQLVDSGKLLPVVFLPFLVLDDAVPITTKAAIDFVSSSDYVNGELYAFGELRNLFSRSTLANRAAVFGALVAIGDAEVLAFLEELRPQLTADEVREAARVHTQFPQHRAIQYWLRWAKDLVSSPNHDDQRTFGSCASALIIVLDFV